VRSRRSGRAGAAVTLVAGTLFSILPIYWLLITAFKPQREIFARPPTFWPQNPSFDNFERLFSESSFSYYLINSVAIVACAVVLSLVIGSLAAYSLARFRLLGGSNEAVGFGVLAVRMIPPIVILVPIYLIIVRSGLRDSYAGLILVYTAVNIPFVIWMMRSFLEEIPSELEEAAMMDGASRMRALRNVVVPLAAPGVVATAIFSVIVTYNDFIFALVLTSTPESQTVPVGAASFIGRSVIAYGPVAAAGLLASVPIIVFALLVQRHLVRGLTMGSFR
jgi:multiple sugar transport system permease protein